MKIVVKSSTFPKMILKTGAHENFRGFEPFEVFKVIFSELFDPLITLLSRVLGMVHRKNYKIPSVAPSGKID